MIETLIRLMNHIAADQYSHPLHGALFVFSSGVSIVMSNRRLSPMIVVEVSIHLTILTILTKMYKCFVCF